LQAEDLKAFYLFALLLTGNGREASDLIVETLPALSSQLGQFRHGHHFRARIIRALRQRWKEHKSPSANEFESDQEPERLARFCASLPEPERSTVALFYSNLLDHDDAATLLGLSLQDYAATLASARNKLTELFAYERKES
jgi:DNA-directed RNA polymerase specialized sigma24 family protein